MAISWMLLYPRAFILGRTLTVNSLYVATLGSGEEMPTCASYIRKLLGLGGALFLKIYRDSGGGFQKRAS